MCFLQVNDKKNDSIFRMTIKTGLYTLNLIWEIQLLRPPENSSSMGQRTGLSMSTLTSRDVLILPSTDTRGTRKRGTRKKATNKREKTKLLTVTDSVFILVWFFELNTDYFSSSVTNLFNSTLCMIYFVQIPQSYHIP